MIEVTGLTKRYGSFTAVHDLSLAVRPGEVLGLVGPNGAGKTSTLRCLAGIIPATAGTVHLDGRDLTRLPMHERARHGIGYLPQEASVFRKLTAADIAVAPPLLELVKGFLKYQKDEKKKKK